MIQAKKFGTADVVKQVVAKLFNILFYICDCLKKIQCINLWNWDDVCWEFVLHRRANNLIENYVDKRTLIIENGVVNQIWTSGRRTMGDNANQTNISNSIWSNAVGNFSTLLTCESMEFQRENNRMHTSRFNLSHRFHFSNFLFSREFLYLFSNSLQGITNGVICHV